MTSTPLTRAGLTGVLALTCAGVTGLAVAGPAHAAAPDGNTAGHFLASQLQSGGDHFSVSGYADYGLTIDGVLGLDTLQTGQTEAARAAAYVLKNAAAYNTYGTDLYAGATAKLMLLAEAQGQPTASYVTQLKSLEQPSGQFKDKSAYGDYSNSLTQSLAVIALARAGQSDAAAAGFLAGQQCTDGGFRMSFTAACTGDTDATAFAVQALTAAGGHQAEVTKAVNFIAGKQQANGGVVEPAAQAAPNSNTTGLAAVAFALAGKTAEANKAKSFVQSLQFGCSAPSALQGGIAYDQATFKSLTAAGSKAKVTDKEHRSTVQAALAFSQQPYLKIKAGGAATAPALSCTSTPPTTSPTSAPTGTATHTSPVTGPPIVTDGGSTGGSNGFVLFAGMAALGGAALGGAGLRRRLRSNR